MTTGAHRSIVLTFAVVAIGGAVCAGLNDWPQANRTLEFAGLMAVALLAAAVDPKPQIATRATMPPSFVLSCTALLLLGPYALVAIATAGAVMQLLTDSRRAWQPGRVALHVFMTLASASASAAAYQLSGGWVSSFTWPDQAVYIALAAAVYCLVMTASIEIILPFVTKRPVNRNWPQTILEGASTYLVGAALATATTVIIQQQAWEVGLVAALPVYLLYRGYCSYAERLDEAQWRRDVISTLDHGLSAIDRDGIVTFWDDGVERILTCERERAIGSPLTAVVPALGKSELPRIMADVLEDGSPRTVAHLSLPIGGGRTFQVRMLRVESGVLLLWDDVTNRTIAEQALRRSEQRLALVADGSSDGLWEWDLRSQDFYCSSRWRALLGIAPNAAIGVADWFDRVHPDDRESLKVALDAHLAGQSDQCEHPHRLRIADGSYKKFMCRGVSVRGAGGALRIAGSLTDLAEQGEAFLDSLTGLANRSVFVEGLGRRLAQFKDRTRKNPFAALYLDLDRFKVVNDSLGHMVGDQLLAAVSRRLESCLRRGDALARLGGDEFAILLNDLGDPNQANAIAFRIQESLSKPFTIDGRDVFSSASIGIAIGHAQYNNPDEMMRDADTAMYHAKSRGKARHELFDADMHARELDRLGLETDLRRAVDTNDFEVHYQPIVLLSSGRCVGFESLARWSRHGKPVSPELFIRLAEELRIIEPLGNWMLQQACYTFADWKRRFPQADLDYITVNVSSRQLMQQNFVRTVEQAVEKSALAPCDLRLEVTETALMDSPKEAAHVLHELREFGAKIYLDDFGCGYSSLSHLAKLPVDALKIDRSFVKNLLLPDRPAIVESILALARTLNTGVVAEGIEYEVQGRELKRLGCTHAQGYLFSRPVPTTAAELLIAANRPLGMTDVPQEGLFAAKNHRDSGSVKPASFQWPEEVMARTGS